MMGSKKRRKIDLRKPCWVEDTLVCSHVFKECKYDAPNETFLVHQESWQGKHIDSVVTCVGMGHGSVRPEKCVCAAPVIVCMGSFVSCTSNKFMCVVYDILFFVPLGNTVSGWLGKLFFYSTLPTIGN